ncbi:hypothetical protein FACS1894105_08290 [Clostridia bacterium]|nr:hypothetical protein FACS1894105_08290 [Clostridia bacterium]
MTNITKRIILIITVFATLLSSVIFSAPFSETVSAAAFVGDPASGNELRGTWIASVSNINFPSKKGLSKADQIAELDAIVKTCKDTGLNAIFFQVRPMSDALYDSSIFPTSKFLTGKQGDSFTEGFDPLKYIVEIAHAAGIELHAWINPYRVTTGDEELTDLANSNPARKNPDYTVKYADGKIYYNPGMPEVRWLITEGVKEIVQKYAVDGIHFDDYFYPYPVSENSIKIPFNDAAAFAKYGNGQTIEEFRRESVNTLLKDVYKAVKKINTKVRFGVSPFGISKNKSASQPDGSDTGGFEAYNSLYCDVDSWVKGGYIDYICPQIYWSFNTKVAYYDVLVRWWSALCDGTKVDLYIGHAVYKVPTDFKSEREIPRQVEYARSYMNVAGSVFYGYKNIVANDYNIKTRLAVLFEKPLQIVKPVSDHTRVKIARPTGSSVSSAGVNIMAYSNPAYAVTAGGIRIPRTKSGYFSAYFDLKEGANTIVFLQHGTVINHTIYRGKAPAGEYKYPQMDSYAIDVVTPASDLMLFPGDKITVRVQAPSNSTVTATLGGTSVALTPLTAPPNEGQYMTEVYSGSLKVSSSVNVNGSPVDLGNIVYEAKRGNEYAKVTSVNVKVINESVYGAAEVIKDYSYLKISTTSSFYDDYLPASVGMRDTIVGFSDGFFKLGFGGYISKDDVKLLGDSYKVKPNKISSAEMTVNEKTTDIRLGVSENVPVDAHCVDGVFRVTLYNTPKEGTLGMALAKGTPMFQSVKATYDEAGKSTSYKFDLIDPDNWYGFEVSYESGFIVIRVKNPIKKQSKTAPLEGMTIIVDAGHGGSDTGAIGYTGTKGITEDDLNLAVALKTRDELTALGANVVMIRDTDTTVSIDTRMFELNRINPDLVVSIHHNSLGDTTDNSRTRGFLGLYCNDSGRLLAKNVSRETAYILNRVERTVNYQSLAMLRSHKFPATLVEMLFVTNPDEYEQAMSPEITARSAKGIANGVIAWIDAQKKFILN